ncbi:MAG: hypothetical protein AAGG44_18085, partial [Planctomycetota bacterium]
IRSQLANYQEQIASAKSSLENHAAALGINELSPELLQFRPSDEEKDELGAIKAEFMDLEKAKIESSSKLKALQENELNSSVDKRLEYPQDLGQLAELLAGLERAEQQIEQRTRDLQKLLEDPDFIQLREQIAQPTFLRTRFDDTLAKHWKIPTYEQAAEVADRMRSLSSRDDELRRSAEQLQLQKAELNAEQESHQASSTEEIRSRVEEATLRRDALIQHWQDELSQPLIAASISPQQQSERLDELQGILNAIDELSNRLLQSADSLATSLVRQKALQEYQQRSSKTELDRKDIAEQQQRVQAEWQELWQGAPIKLESPDALLIWTQQFHAWKKLARRSAESRRELHISKQSLRAQREQLVDEWPEIVRETTPLGELKAKLQAWQEGKRDDERNRRQREKMRQQTELLQKTLASAEERSAQLETQFHDWVCNAPIAESCSISSIEKRLASLAALQREHAVLRSAELKLQESDARISEFENQIEHLQLELASLEASPAGAGSATESMGRRHKGAVSQDGGSQRIADRPIPPSRSGSAEHIAMQWLRELNKLREDRDKRVRLQTQSANLSRRIQEQETELSSLEKRLTSLLATVGSDAGSSLQTLMNKLALADDKRLELASLRAELSGIRGQNAGQEVDHEQAELESIGDMDEASLREQEHRLALELTKDEEQLQSIDESIGQLRERLDRIACNGQAQQARQQLQQKRCELQELSEQWIQSKLAQQLLDRSIKLFAEENEPAILIAAKRYLKQLTSGRYIDIEHKSDGKDSFTVRDANGVETPP